MEAFLFMPLIALDEGPRLQPGMRRRFGVNVPKGYTLRALALSADIAPFLQVFYTQSSAEASESGLPGMFFVPQPPLGPDAPHRGGWVMPNSSSVVTLWFLHRGGPALEVSGAGYVEKDPTSSWREEVGGA